MGDIAFAGPLTVGAALLAFWLDCRFDKRRPASAVRRFVHAGIAFAFLQISTGVAGHLASGDAPAARRLLAVFFLVLPGFVYAFLASVWLVRTLFEATRLAGR
jgi:hypothetical protein